MNLLQRLYYNIKLKKQGIHISKYFLRVDYTIYDIAEYDSKEQCYIVFDDNNNTLVWTPKYKHPYHE